MLGKETHQWVYTEHKKILWSLKPSWNCNLCTCVWGLRWDVLLEHAPTINASAVCSNVLLSPAVHKCISNALLWKCFFLMTKHFFFWMEKDLMLPGHYNACKKSYCIVVCKIIYFQTLFNSISVNQRACQDMKSEDVRISGHKQLSGSTLTFLTVNFCCMDKTLKHFMSHAWQTWINQLFVEFPFDLYQGHMIRYALFLLHNLTLNTYSQDNGKITF